MDEVHVVLAEEDLINQLRAAIDEDERIAREATPGPWRVNDEDLAEIIYGGEDYDYDVVSGGRWGGEAPPFNSTADAIHIARHDPQRVLDMVAVYRAILDLYERRGGAILRVVVKALAQTYRIER